MKCRKAGRLFIHVVCPVMAGAVLYYLFCPDILFVKGIDRICGGGLHFQINMDRFLIKLIRNYFMDFVWAYSLLAFLVIAFADYFDVKFLFVTAAIFEVFTEAAQKIVFVAGTFDIFDIVVEIIANILVIHFLSRREYTK